MRPDMDTSPGLGTGLWAFVKPSVTACKKGYTNKV